MKNFNLLAFLGFLTVVACANVVEELSRLGCKTLAQLVKDAGLAETLSGKGPFTVFAPSQKAFENVPTDILDKLKTDKALLAQVLTFHVVSGNVTSEQLSNNQLVETVEGTAKIRVNIYGQVITIDGAKVILADQPASNGVIHVLDKVLYPLPSMSLLDFLASSANFATLIYSAERADIVDFFKGDGPFTLFAPTEAAFKKLPPDTLNKLYQDVPKLIDLLKYHVVSDTVYSAGLSNGQKVTAANDKQLTVSIREGKVSINDAKVTGADNPVSNGVIHIIDTVLVPPSL